MRLKKVKVIKNVWSFKEYEWSKFAKFKSKSGSLEEAIIDKKNIFFGDNGNGKTTLVKILKHLGGTNLILNKNWESPLWEQEILIETDIGNVLFNWLWWDSDKFNWKILFFDEIFIKDNVWDFHDEETNTVSKKRWEHFFTLWSFTQKEDKLLQLNNERNSINKTLWWTQSDILDMESWLPHIIDPAIRATKKIEFEKIISENSKKLTEHTKKKDNLQTIKTTSFPGYPILNVEQFKLDCSVFSEQLGTINFVHGEESVVREIISIIHENSAEKCFVCDQNIKDTEGNYIPRIQDLIKASVWTDILEKEKDMNKKLDSLRDFLNWLKKAWSRLEDFKVEYSKKIELLKNLWDTTDYKSVEDVIFSLSPEEDSLVDDFILSVNNKQKSKSSVISPREEWMQILNQRLEEMQNIIWSFLKMNQEALDKIKLQNISNIQTEIFGINKAISDANLKLNFVNNFDRIDSFFIDCRNFYMQEIPDGTFILKTSLNDLRTWINEKFRIFVKKYEEPIKKFIQKINSSLTIDFSCKVDGGISHWSSRCTFQLEYNGLNISRELSQGEKRVIALAYFFALREKEVEEDSYLSDQITAIDVILWDVEVPEEERRRNSDKKILLKQRQQELKEKIIVFDDPSVDFDAWHKQMIAIEIANLSNFYNQTIVFTHDEKFYDYIKDKNFDMRFSVQKIHKGSIVGCIWKGQIDLYEEDLKDFFDHGTPLDEYFCIRECVYKLRYCVENWVKNEWLLWDQKDFRDILNKIWWIKILQENEINEFKDIYNFCNMNGSHEWSCEWYNALKKYIPLYFQIKQIPL